MPTAVRSDDILVVRRLRCLLAVTLDAPRSGSAARARKRRVEARQHKVCSEGEKEGTYRCNQVRTSRRVKFLIQLVLSNYAYMDMDGPLHVYTAKLTSIPLASLRRAALRRQAFAAHGRQQRAPVATQRGG